MSKAWKIFLWIAIPVGVLVLLIGVAIWQASLNSYGRDQAGVPSFGMMGKATSVRQADYAGMPGAATGMMVNEEYYAEKNVSAPEVAPQTSGQPAADVGVQRLIIKTGSLSLVVGDVKTAITAIAKYAVEKKGFVVTSNVEKNGLDLAGEITIRIPSAEFDNSLTQVKTFGEVRSEHVDGQDVTEQYVDLDSQLRNLRATESQLLSIMQRAVKIEDVLAVQEQLTSVRAQIEGIQGRMKYLKQSAEMSSLTIYLSTDPSTLPLQDEQNTWKPWSRIKDAARSLLSVGKALVNILIWLVVYIPLWIVIGLVVWGVVKLIKRKKAQ